jgi:hypothetical protein
MGTAKCKECGGDVSSKATVCPHCGLLDPAATGKQSTPAVKAAKVSILTRSRDFAGLLFYSSLLWLFFSTHSGGDDAFFVAWDKVKWLIAICGLWYIVAEIYRIIAERKHKMTEKI